ncbi:MAG: hypothetical protein J6T74_07350, partial [Clostridia bacterium]|nr:hypothetical protein [Clostridia bacterium]
MNKGNLNKLVTNYPVELTEEEISNLSGTLAPVIAACGGGGGGTGGKIYTGIGFVNVNNTTNQIGLTNEANTKLNQDIPTKVSDLTDSANYQTVAGMDEYLTTANAQTLYQTKNDMSAYLTSANASSTYQTKEDMTAYLTTANANSDYAKKTLVETVSGNIVAKIPTKTSQLSNDKPFLIHQDMVNYGPGWMDLNDGLSTKQDTLTFGYDENNAISSINDSALAGTTYIEGNGISIASDTISISADYIQAITSVSGKQDELAFTYNTSNAITHINGSAIAGEGGGGTTVYSGTDGVYVDGNNIGLSADYKTQIEAVSSKLTKASADTLYAPISVTGDVNTLKSSSGNWDKVSAKLDTTAFSTVSGSFLTAHQSLEDYATKSDINDMATQTWVSEQGYITQETDWTNTIQEASAKAYNDATANANSLYQAKGDYVKNTDIGLDSNNKVTAISGKELIITAHQSLTNYYTKSETSGASEIENALTGKQDKLTFAGESNTITSINNSAVGGGTSFTGVTTAGSISGDGLTNPLGLVTSAEQALAAVDGKVSKPTASQQQLVYVVWDKGPAQNWTDFAVAANSWANTFLFDEEYPIVNGNNGLSAGLVPGEYNDVYEVGIDTTNMAANKQYAFTTTGWAEVQAGTSFTGVSTGVGLSGTGLSNSP